MTRNVLLGFGLILIVVIFLLVNFVPGFRQQMDDSLRHNYEYEKFVTSAINAKVVEDHTEYRGGYFVFKNSKGYLYKFLFFDRYEPFASYVNVNDSIKKEPNKKEFYIIKPDTSFVVHPRN